MAADSAKTTDMQVAIRRELWAAGMQGYRKKVQRPTA
jgi:hypothetical protein